MNKYAIIRLDNLGEEDPYYKNSIKNVRELFTSTNEFIEYDHNYQILTEDQQLVLKELFILACNADKKYAVSLYKELINDEDL